MKNAQTEITLDRQKQIDFAVFMNSQRCDILELTLGELVNSETIHEGRYIFKFENLFCTSENKRNKRIITVNTKGFKN